MADCCVKIVSGSKETMFSFPSTDEPRVFVNNKLLNRYSIVADPETHTIFVEEKMLGNGVEMG